MKIIVSFSGGKDSDAVSLGYFDNVQDAMKAILESNHPDYSGYYI